MNTTQVYYYLRELHEGMFLRNIDEEAGVIEFHYNRIEYRAIVDNDAQQVRLEFKSFSGQWKPKMPIHFNEVA